MKFTNLEKILPFGYIILVVLGIIKESVYYYQVGINILKYSNLMDILISPISDLTSHPLILTALIVYITAMYFIFVYASKNKNNKWASKLIMLNNSDLKPTTQESQIRLTNKLLSILLVCIMCFFLGIGIGNGKKVSDNIESNNITYKHFITFSNDESKLIYLIGSNSSNIFYIEQGNTNVKISPLSAIKTIEFLKE